MEQPPIVIQDKVFRSGKDITDAIAEAKAELRRGSYREAPSIEDLADRVKSLEEAYDGYNELLIRSDRRHSISYKVIIVMQLCIILAFIWEQIYG